ncbi:hypothetical protein [Absidia glauca]|uniref:OTU domain-containing protein n=1 Tax=Absidia glauca TaxID=4829 RepID=A0A168R6X6_ABSGL|nr:hypothetical protein [Absidia glauca]
MSHFTSKDALLNHIRSTLAIESFKIVERQESFIAIQCTDHRDCVCGALAVARIDEECDEVTIGSRKLIKQPFSEREVQCLEDGSTYNVKLELYNVCDDGACGFRALAVGLFGEATKSFFHAEELYRDVKCTMAVHGKINDDVALTGNAKDPNDEDYWMDLQRHGKLLSAAFGVNLVVFADLGASPITVFRFGSGNDHELAIFSHNDHFEYAITYTRQ